MKKMVYVGMLKGRLDKETMKKDADDIFEALWYGSDEATTVYYEEGTDENMEKAYQILESLRNHSIGTYVEYYYVDVFMVDDDGNWDSPVAFYYSRDFTRGW